MRSLGLYTSLMVMMRKGEMIDALWNKLCQRAMHMRDFVETIIPYVAIALLTYLILRVGGF